MLFRSMADFRCPDELGLNPVRKCINGKHALDWALRTDLDLEKVLASLQRGPPRFRVRLSSDPGRFLCNYIYYCTLSSCCALRHSHTSESVTIDSAHGQVPCKVQELDIAAKNKADEVQPSNTSVQCHSLFVHVPPFSAISHEEQLVFVKALLLSLADCLSN